ncbi:hypothetical protein M3C31_00075 [Staphylococcus hominis]|uniref:phage tail spike protein n=1 Tax=Staphylococcus hominis TaxID=1290 RepID=UPI0021A2D5D1|nr:phage tail spike protein [Staphylococcus hominis]MCT1482243.1 hypothetical protein [Staphylococcus hominis]
MIHILDFNDNIIDFISRDDGAVTKAEMTRNVQEMVETLDFTVLSERADNVRERNRVIAQDYNGVYREFIITHVEDDLEGLTDVKCNASYLEDLATAKPLKPQTFEKMSTTQALLKTLADTGWEVSDETEYGGMRSKSWTSYNNPYQVIGMLETAYDMVADFYIELGSHTVEHRYVSLKHPNSLFKGKEIVKGKDLTGLTRTVDTSEVRTALIALGPEDEQGNRISTIVKDDEAHEQFGLPGRYLWDIYEPESEDTNMTLERLTTLAKTELNKRKQMSVSYEISALDIHRYYNDVQVELRDKVRVKDRDFNPPLYVEAEVLAFTYNLILDDTTFTFGNVVEFEEDTLRQEFTRRLDKIRKKLQDDISNVNTIVNDAVEGQLEYFEPKIIKSDEAPEKPVEDMLWYDTSNSNVAVLRRYVNGEWRNETAKDVEQLGGMAREKVLYNSLNNTFANLNIQHSKLLDEVYKLLNNEYLVDDDLRLQLDNAMNSVINVYNNIKTNLDSMTPETATIGKLIDTQALFLRYRERLQDLYKAMRNAQIAADDRLKLLQSQYTDKKFNDAMNKIAETLPNGRWDSENQRLYADIPNRNDVNNVRQALQEYTDGQISDLNSVLGKEIDSKINTTKSEINANISSVERKIDGIEVGGRNLFIQDASYYNDEALYGYRKISDTKTKKVITIKEKDSDVDISGIYFGLSVNGKDSSGGYRWEINSGELLRELDNNNSLENYYYISYFPNEAETLEKLSKRFDIKIENGTVPTTYTLAPEDLQNEIVVKSTEISKAQSDAAETRAQAYADSKITNEEQARIRQADANLQLLQQQQQSLKNEMAAYTDNLINEEERARIEADTAKEEALKAEINLAQTQANAYADNKITAEEERAIQDAQTKFEEAKKHAEEKAAQAQSLANEYAKAAQENAQNYTDNKVNNLSVGSRNLLEGSAEIKKDFDDETSGLKQFFRVDITSAHSKLELGDVVTVSFDVEMEQGNILRVYDTNINFDFIVGMNTFENIGNKKQRISFTKKLMQANKESDKWLLDFYNKGFTDDKYTISNIKIEKGSIATDWTPAPEDLQRQIKQAQQEAQEAAKEYADAQDNLKETNIKAYADGIVSDEEKRAIQDAENKLKEAKTHAKETAEAARQLAEQNASIDAAAKAQKAQENAQTAAEAYAKAQDELKETKIKAYADEIVSEEEQRAIQDAEDKLATAQAHAEETAKAAQQAAQNYAKTQAETAQTQAEAAAKAYAKAQDELKQTETKAYADGIVSDEEQRAIADAIAKRDEAKEYAEQKAQEAQEAANQNTINQLKPITTRVTTNEANITELDNQISLMAKSDDVAQKLRNVDERLIPLETTVKSNKATLDILPTQIESKVSKQDYTLDKNNIVQRLDNADSQRKQLSNEITDKVTITKFESGITEAKNHADNVKEEATTYTDNKINSLSVGSRNLLENSANIKKEFNDEMAGLTQFYRVNLSDIHNKLRLGDVVTISFDVEMEQGNILRVYDTNVNYNFILGMETFNDIGKGKKRLHFTKTLTQANKDSSRWLLDFSNSGNVEDKYTISNIKIEKGNVATDWTPAPEDIERAISNSNEEAQKAAKAYADAQDNLRETNIKAYADGIVSDEEERAIADAESKLETAKADAQTKADAAKEVAKDYALAQAQIAQTEAEKAAKAYADAQDNLKETKIKAYADGIVSEEEKRAIADAQSKFEEAKQNATEKANAAQMAAQDYAEEKANAAEKVAKEAAQAYADAQDELKETQLKAYADGIVSDEEKRAIQDAENKLKEAKTHAEEKAAQAQNLASDYAKTAQENAKNYTDNKVNNLSVGSRNLLEGSAEIKKDFNDEISTLKQFFRVDITSAHSKLELGDVVTVSFDVEMEQGNILRVYDTNVNYDFIIGVNTFENIGNKKQRISFTKKLTQANKESDKWLLDFYNKGFTDDKYTISNIKIEKGSVATDWTPAPEDLQRQIQQVQQEAQEAAKEYADAQDNLKETNIKAYADGIVSDEEKRAIQDAENKLKEAKTHAKETAEAARQLAEQNASIDAAAKAQKAQENAQTAAEAYAKAQDELKETKIKAYADEIVSEEEQRAIQDAEDKLATAQAHAEETAKAAQQAAQNYAKTQAETAQTQAEAAAKAYAKAQDELKQTETKAYADGIVSDEEQRAIADAESKLQEAKTHAEETSSAAQTAAEEYAVIKANDAETNAKNDATTKANKAEVNAKAYTDEYKQSNDVAMTELETSISQLDGKISIKVDEQKFNASQETLSKVLTEIAATTSGINLTYDNNGAIQGVTVDNGGVKLRGDKVDITVNDEFRVMANRVDDVRDNVNNKVGKDEIINRLNLSPEGLDIDVNKVGIRGGDSTNYIKIQNSGFLSYGNFKRSWAGEVDDAKLELGISNGRVLIRNQSTGYRLYLTERGLSTMMDGFSEDTSGTLEFHSTRFNDTSRGITMHSTYGAVAMLSEQSRAIVRSNLTANIESYLYGVYIRPYVNTRPGINEFNFYVKSNDNTGDTDGAILFGEVSDERGLAGSGIRFKKKGLRGELAGEYEPIVYATDNQGNIGTGSFHAHKFIGDLWARNTNIYAQVDNEFRITDRLGYNDGTPNYKDLRVNSINTTSSYAFSNHSGADVYFGVGYHELRITANNHYNGGNPSYQNIRFGKWYAMSSEKFKYDIKEWNYSVLDAFRNDLQLYSFKHKSDKESNYIRNHHGVIIEREMPIEWRHGDGIDGNEIMFWNTKAIQELIAIVDKQNGKINELEEEVKWLKTKI